jgi:two-component system chemotaxis response regulator CheB
MDGIEAARRIRAGWPKLPVVMCSTHTERGADVTLRALAAGASDYVPKPTRLGSREAAMGAFRDTLLPKLKTLGGRLERLSLAPSPPLTPIFRPRTQPVSLIAIGASTGGPNALATLIAGLPADIGVPIVIVQHMPPLFTKMLATRLDSLTDLEVKEAEDGDLLQPNCAYIAPGDFHVTLVRNGDSVHVALNQETPENSCRPAVDVTFRSAASTYGPGVLAAILTGMGRDGTRGARAVVDAGGTVVVQDQQSSVIPSMPSSVASAGLADAVVPLDNLGAELAVRVWRSRLRASLATAQRQT